MSVADLASILSARNRPGAGRHSRITAGHIVDTLRASEYPLTTLEVAQRLNAKASTMSARLSRLADFGVIARQRRSLKSHPGTYCVWSALPDV